MSDQTETTDQRHAHDPEHDGATGPNGELETRSVLVDERGVRRPSENREQDEAPAPNHRVRNIVLLVIGVLLLGTGLWFGIPMLIEAFRTVSTDDAFVASHVTNLGPRIQDKVVEVLVDEDEQVKAGQVLVRLDRVPFELGVATAEADFAEAKASLIQTRATVLGDLESARASYFAYKNSLDMTKGQIAQLEANVAALRSAESDLTIARKDYGRYEVLAERGSATRSEFDDQRNRLEVAEQNVKQAQSQIEATRAGLGVPPKADDPLDLPDDIIEKRSTVEQSKTSIATSLARVGIPFDVSGLKGKDTFQKIVGLEESANLDEALKGFVDETPQVKQAEARVVQSERALDNAELQLSYTEIVSPIDGYVENRSVHPGDEVQIGQTLLTLRPLEVWIDANFKETQLDDIVIGRPVDLHVDAYPDSVFKGRIAGFSPATGPAASLLPPENATGNYIKIVQRLPVRIELIEPPPTETPLFVGLSVVPVVRLDQEPTGPGAGQRLRAGLPPVGIVSDSSPGRAGRPASPGDAPVEGR